MLLLTGKSVMVGLQNYFNGVVMTEYDVKKFALALAIQAEIEGMKVANAGRDLPAESAAYDESHFFAKSQELEELAAKHDHEM